MLLKLVVLLALIVATLMLFGVIGKIKRKNREAVAEQARDPLPAGEETHECPVCGTYVVASRPSPCGRADCPQ